MIIETKDLKEFLRLSRPIKHNGIIPVLSNIKLEAKDGIITLSKTNLNSYCLHKIEADFRDETVFLLDETKVSALINNTSDQIISIKEKKKTIELSDDTSIVSFQKDDITTYPAFPSGNGEKFTIDVDIIDAIGVAKSYITDTDIPTQWSYVFGVPDGDGSIIYGAELSGFYLKRFERRIPALCLTKEAASLISVFETADYYVAGNYDFFTNGNTTFGFIKNQSSPLPISKLLNRVPSENKAIVTRSDIIKFCDTAISLSNGLFAPVTMRDCESGLMFTYGNEGGLSEMVADISAEKNGVFSQVGLGIKALSKCLKALPYDKIIIREQSEEGFNGLIVTNEEDSGYFGIIMGLK